MTSTLTFLLLLGSLLAAPGSRIIGGLQAYPGQFPFVVSLNNPGQFCDGSIINSKWVVTAAHCITDVNPDTTVLAGTIYQSTGGTTYNISRAIAHEGFDTTNGKDDIGLIEIEGEFEFGEELQAVEFGDPEVNATCYAAGWGQTEHIAFPEVLQFVELLALTDEDCRETIGDMDQLYLGPEQVCGFGGEGYGVCFGDSGGPLVCGGKLAGIVSYAVRICGQGYPDVYTRPSAYVDWIAENIE